MSAYKIVRGILTVFIKVCFRVKYYGLENLPKDNGYIFCANHIGMTDPLLLACNKNIEFHFIAKEELIKIPVLGWILKKVNVIPIKRGSGDLGAMKKGIEVLNNKKSLIIFPEGTRSKTGEMGEAKNGMALLVKKTGCGVVPCAIVGKPNFFKKSKVVYGEPIPAGFFDGEKNLDYITSYIVDRIKILIKDNK